MIHDECGGRAGKIPGSSTSALNDAGRYAAHSQSCADDAPWFDWAGAKDFGLRAIFGDATSQAGNRDAGRMFAEPLVEVDNLL
jgi:hypothetical protein